MNAASQTEQGDMVEDAPNLASDICTKWEFRGGRWQARASTCDSGAAAPVAIATAQDGLDVEGAIASDSLRSRDICLAEASSDVGAIALHSDVSAFVPLDLENSVVKDVGVAAFPAVDGEVILLDVGPDTSFDSVVAGDASQSINHAGMCIDLNANHVGMHDDAISPSHSCHAARQKQNEMAAYQKACVFTTDASCHRVSFCGIVPQHAKCHLHRRSSFCIRILSLTMFAGFGWKRWWPLKTNMMLSCIRWPSFAVSMCKTVCERLGPHFQCLTMLGRLQTRPASKSVALVMLQLVARPVEVIGVLRHLIL